MHDSENVTSSTYNSVQRFLCQMDLHVIFQGALSGKTSCTRGTREWFLFRVNPHMLFKSAWAETRSATPRTTVWVTTRAERKNNNYCLFHFSFFYNHS